MNEPLPIVFYSLAQLLGEILPFPVHAAQEVLKDLFPGLSVSTEVLLLGQVCVFAAIALRFRHDLFSQIVSVIRLAVERRRPMAVDETMPLLYLCTLLPVVLVGLVLPSETIAGALGENGWILHALALIAAGLTVWVETRMNHSKTFAYWNVLEASLIGIVAILSNLPFLTFLTAAFIVGRFRGFRLDALLKYALICSLPLQLGAIIHQWQGWHSLIQGIGLIGVAITVLTNLGVTFLLLSILTGHRPPRSLAKLGVLNALISIGAIILWFKART